MKFIKEKKIIFDKKYYNSVMKEFGYNPLEFERINFSLGKLNKGDLQRRWLCHHAGGRFSRDINRKKSIVTTGLGLTGIPHIGTLSQILRSIALQRAGIPVQLVLGDLDAYNHKAKPLKEALGLVEKYRKFILRLGFKNKFPSILRAQYDELQVLRTSYLIGHFIDHEMFNGTEEDLHNFYSRRGKIDKEMTYRRQLSLNLMTADFIDLYFTHGFKNVLVMLGVDEHQYVRFAEETIRRIKLSNQFKGFDLNLSALYSPLIKGFYNYPKMSKSFPKSGITVDMTKSEIRDKIMNGEGSYNKPENNVVYQMMAAASYYNSQELKERYNWCLNKTKEWEKAKEDYAKMLIEICSLWH
jgi:tryptophanyl-tRNA synthetase